jgi:hypothetical protein
VLTESHKNQNSNAIFKTVKALTEHIANTSMLGWHDTVTSSVHTQPQQQLGQNSHNASPASWVDGTNFLAFIRSSVSFPLMAVPIAPREVPGNLSIHATINRQKIVHHLHIQKLMLYQLSHSHTCLTLKCFDCFLVKTAIHYLNEK